MIVGESDNELPSFFSSSPSSSSSSSTTPSSLLESHVNEKYKYPTNLSLVSVQAPPTTPSQRRRHEVASKNIAFLLVLSMFVGATHFSTTISSLNVSHSQYYQFQHDQQDDNVGGAVESSSSSSSLHSLVSTTFRTISNLLEWGKQESATTIAAATTTTTTSISTVPILETELVSSSSSNDHNDNIEKTTTTTTTNITTMATSINTTQNEHKHQKMQQHQAEPLNVQSNIINRTNITSDTSSLITDSDTYYPRPRSVYSWSQQQQQQQQKQDDSFNDTTVVPKTTTATTRLAFLHIPKTGGSSIEHAGAKGGQTWGLCLFTTLRFCKHSNINRRSIVGSLANQHQSSQPFLPASDDAWRDTVIQNKELSLEYFGGRSFPLWHLPIQYLPSYPTNVYYDSNLTDPYHDQHVFAVVRNPYKRIVSEYYYACHITNCLSKQNDTATRMNHVIQQTLTRNHRFIKSGTSGWITTNTTGVNQRQQQPHRKYFIASGHWIPQYDYIYSYSPSSVSNTTSNNNNTSNTTSNSNNNNLVEQVRHIIHFEHLTKEFASLMDAYQLPVNLTTVNQQLSRSDWNTQQTVADLDSQTRRLIEDVYELDFELGGGYIMIERTKLARNDPTNRHVCSDGQLLYVVGSKTICL
ncbi:sulfotransferase family protein [Nitzschia inconspicua]|uniref:Sulfotransferase family protein n=1 Tax=Nitzschia inconspicua TaxID=303405 RepID=A0A9K3LWR5_9STRA|nr:sulfotransferase family protein [Nitzschia inconspicua]